MALTIMPTIRIRQGDSNKKYIQVDYYGSLVHWPLVLGVRMDVRNHAGVLMSSYTIGNGLTIGTIDTRLFVYTSPALRQLAPGNYSYDVKFAFTQANVKTSPKGVLIFEDTNTHSI